MLLLTFLFSIICFTLYRWYKENKRHENISDKYVYITGCDTGFGNLLAKSLDKQGVHVLAACFTDKGQDDLKKNASPKLKTFHLDVTKSESVRKAAEFIKSEVGEKGLWGLVNNAGITMPLGFSDWLSTEDYKSILEVNLIGVIDVTLSVLQLIKKSQGRIVNMSSICGRLCISSGGYCISKFGVEAFTDMLRTDMRYFGVNIACIEPGFFKTLMTSEAEILKSYSQVWDRAPAEVKDDYGHDFCEKLCASVKGRIDSVLDSDLTKVTWCMEHALFAVYPRTRYSAGWDAKILWLPLSYMPTTISDYVLSKMRKLVPAKSVI
ncbi:retinol dehydrogenase 16-like [Protopterus annectens]|uniref:retinol dehydrogenase 16-like n=1 Tax=Protopterus annectens TaxID=7888 RepID=UPI001CFC2FA3|nr:retinol dehydrogenase 16-like [Protopterus annectens]